MAGAPCFVTRSGYTGEDGFELSVAAEDAVAVAEALLREPEVAPIGLGARDTLRLEAGLCLYGHDIDETTTPVEAGLAWAIGRRRSRCRLSRRRDDPAATRRGAGAQTGRHPSGRPRAGARGHRDYRCGGNPIGRVTSGGFGPSVGAPVAMGYVEAAHAAEGEALALVVRDVPRPARVARLPFVPTRYYRGRPNTVSGGSE